jgi:precorrin-4/cobalt-precorrin-4 C11-methyltransferase
VFRCPLCELAATAEANGLTKLALILVGGFLGDEYDRSKLYDPGFSTEFRAAEEEGGTK